ncbi:MAG: hypothetical protein KA120_04960 [Candidatus Goldbacteria bacterium]|nr:hypothetical protein [Candidatus Goldiibacteriota bacterium]
MANKILVIGPKYNLKKSDMTDVIETWIDMYNSIGKTKNKPSMIRGLLRVASGLYVPGDCKIRHVKVIILMAATLAKKGNEDDIDEVFSLLNEALRILKS